MAMAEALRGVGRAGDHGCHDGSGAARQLASDQLGLPRPRREDPLRELLPPNTDSALFDGTGAGLLVLVAAAVHFIRRRAKTGSTG